MLPLNEFEKGKSKEGCLTRKNKLKEILDSLDLKYIGNVEDEFHDYILLWEEDGITISVDDIVVGKWATNPTETWESWPWHHRFHLILNMAIGGSWGGQQGVDDSIWPQKLEVDYVRVYQKT